MKKLHNDPPEKEWKEVSWYEFLKRSGAIEIFRKKGVLVNPTHDSSLLKGKRLELFGQAMAEFIAERKKNGLETNEADLNLCYLEWLEGELNVVAKWLSKKDRHDASKPLHSASERIEIKKYREWVNEQIKSVQDSPVKSKENIEVGGNVPGDSLESLIQHEKSADIAEAIKVKFANSKGRELKLLLVALQEAQFIKKHRMVKRFFDCCERELSGNNGTYSGMNDYKYEPGYKPEDEKEVENIKSFLANQVNS